MPASSVNFAFLASHDPFLVALVAQAEKYFADDAAIALIKLRQLGEQIAQRTAAYAGIYTSAAENQVDLLRRLQDRGVFRRDTADLFHSLRRAGNAAAHESKNDRLEALQQLKIARKLAVWFHEQFGPPGFKCGPFVPPPEPKDESKALREEIERLAAAASTAKLEAEQQKALAEQAKLEALSATERAKKEAEDRALIEALALENEKNFAQQLAQIQAATAKQPAAKVEAVITRAAEAAEKIELDESGTRRLIDAQLRDAGWEVDSATMTYAAGVRPQPGKNLAIAEWPTANGPADYVLFIGLMPVAVVEAKRSAKDVAGSIEQAKRYSRGFELTDALEEGQVPRPVPLRDQRPQVLPPARDQERHPDARRPPQREPSARARGLAHAGRSHGAARAGLRPFARRAPAGAHRISQPARLPDPRHPQGRGGDRRRSARDPRRDGDRHRQDEDDHRPRLPPAQDEALPPHPLPRRPQRARRADRERVQGRPPREPPDLHRHLRAQGPRRRKAGQDHEGPRHHHPGDGEAGHRHEADGDTREVPSVDAYDCIIVDECHRGYLLDRVLGDDASRALADLASLNPAVLAKAFRGELVPQNPTDEPAEALLARLRAAVPAPTPKPPRRSKPRLQAED